MNNFGNLSCLRLPESDIFSSSTLHSVLALIPRYFEF